MNRHLRAVPFGAALLVLLLALGLAACGSDDDGGGGAASADIPAKPESGQITMGIQPWIGYGPWYIAAEKGFFADQGIDVKLTNFTTDNDLNSAFASGKMDVANAATHTALKLVEAGLDAKLVLVEDVSTTADAIVAGPEIGSIKDLAGQRVAYEEGTTSDILLRFALAENGMSIDDIEPVPLPAADAGSALIAGRVPAAVTYEPYLSTALKQDQGSELLYTAGENPGLISDVLIASDDMLAERPGQLAALAGAWAQAVDFYMKDPKAGQRIIADAVGAKVEELATAFDGVKFFDLAQNVDELTGRYANETVAEVARVGVDAGILGGEPDTSELIDPRFVEEANQR
jgi:NitT/TauT family transport system substrate-binding protein